MGKKMRAAVEKLEPRAYALREAVDAVKRSAYTKFDESVDLALRLGVDPKRADQMVRGTTSLPHGTGKKIRVEHWVVAERQGQVVARNMLGHRDQFNDIPFFWSAHYDTLSIGYIGHVERWDETRIDGDLTKLDCAVSYIVNGKRRAMATINRDRQSLQAEVAMERELLLKPPPAVTVEPSA